MNFSDKLSLQTKESHYKVDKHPFVKLIETNDYAGELYINLNKICISTIQKEFSENITNFKNFEELLKKLDRDICCPVDIYISKNIENLLINCKKYPLEHAYMFYIGLLFGGSILSRKLPKYKEFLKFENKSELIKEFREYLNNNVKNEEDFINIVNKSYDIIKNIFDDFYSKFSDLING